MPELPLRPLGSSDLRVTPVGIGTAPIGSNRSWRIYWGHQDEREAIRAIRAAIDAGVNWIDTAPFYGWGGAEGIVGKAVRGRRDRVSVFTKCGTVRGADGDDAMDLSPSAVRADVDASLERLGLDHVDLLMPHDVDPAVPIEETWGAVLRLVAEGKVRFGGLSNHGTDLMERALAVGPVVAAQHRFNLVHREVERDVLPFCVGRGIGLLTWGSLAEGLLTEGFDVGALEPDDFRRSRPNFVEPRYPRIRALTRELSRIAAPLGMAASDVALAWLRSRPGVAGTIVGVRTEGEARALARSGAWEPPTGVVDQVDDALARFDAAL
jgi:aryl-alcohol dehydrogenase-like predicted oxidoreductase